MPSDSRDNNHSGPSERSPRFSAASGIRHFIRLLDSCRDLVDTVHHRYFGSAQETEERIKKYKAETSSPGRGILSTLKLILVQALRNPESLAEHYARFASLALEALRDHSNLEPDPKDRRWKDEMWRGHPFFRGLMQLYLAWDQTLHEWAAAQDLSPEDRRRVDFILKQFTAAFSPTNLPLHPGALKRAESTKGESAVRGLHHWIDDVLHHHGMPRQIRPDAYRLGVDLAVTPGAVVLRTPHLELIQYAPQTATVTRRPILIIPPQVNKYYIFDLRPENSLINFLVASGLQVFTLSWRNPGSEQRDWGMDSYIQATLQAIAAVRTITQSKRIGLVSACAGGLTALALLGYLAEKDSRIVSHHSMLVTAALGNNASTLELFATPEAMEAARSASQVTGTMDGRDLATVFTWLRPNDLVWSYWVNNILMGRDPPALDVLYWDNDSTRLPAALHGDFIDMCGSRAFEHPNRLRVLGTEIDFRKLCVDSYFVAGSDDELMPWHGVYRTALQFRGNHSFVLSTSGHVQSLLRPPRLGRVEFLTREGVEPTPEAWLATAQRMPGSWWPHWAAWLRDRSGPVRVAITKLGSAEFPALDAAPGRYIHERIA